MKKIAICLMATGLLLTFQPLQSMAGEIVSATSKVNTVKVDVVNEKVEEALMMRLNEIKEMDHSSLNSKEKRALRKEVRTINNELQHPGGVYISVGGAILIIFLLIILF